MSSFVSPALVISKGLGTDDNALIAVLCTKNNSEILAVKAAYQELFNKTLEADVRGDTSGWCVFFALPVALWFGE